jgi:NAD(P)-dependent dehydrogenase (short-subunit alcohol dehydrogenase family)
MGKTFSEKSTTEDVLEGQDLTGKHILVTGVSSGLGVETVRAVVAHGATALGTARDLPKAKAALIAAMGEKAFNEKVELLDLNLSSLKSIRAAADKVNAAGKTFDVVIANAGIMACPKGFTEDGFELQFGSNHLGHFVFVNRIAGQIKDGGRVVSLSSGGHHFSDVDLKDPNFETTPYEEFLSYGRSKTANILFAVEFDRRHKARGVRAAAVHPGAIHTELSRHLDMNKMQAILEAMKTTGARPIEFKTVPQGAATSIWAGLVAPAEAVGGRYCQDCQVAKVSDDVKDAGVRSYALDAQNAKNLWALSEKIVGETF